MTEKQKPDVTLSDGTEVYFDKHKIKPREWRALFSSEQSDEEGWRIMGNFAGLDESYVGDLSMYDWQMLIAAAVEKVREPVPNSRSASILPS